MHVPMPPGMAGRALAHGLGRDKRQATGLYPQRRVAVQQRSGQLARPHDPMTITTVAPNGSEAPFTGNGDARAKTSFWALMLGSIGVVYGDIGTSPLYALRESVHAAVGANNPATEPAVFGILSLIIWALIVI